ncbi:hypothetical protein [Stieleria maiorica]|nr:hypothetical protein [Stieleria maiorica]
MTNSQRLATVRAHLQRWLAATVTPSRRETVSEGKPEGMDQASSDDAQGDANEAGIVSESILIRDGFYAGRTFHATTAGDTYRATWFMEPDELKIHGAGGTLVASFQGDEIGAEIPVVEIAVVETPVLDEQDAQETPDSEPVSIPMPAAEEESATDLDSDHEGQLPRAA